MNIPSVILENGVPYDDWNEEDLWNLDIEVIDMDIEKLLWHLDLPFWNYKEEYDLTPNMVLEDKEKYSKEYERILNSDISYPIDLFYYNDKYIILDGLHRLVKHKLLGNKIIKVKVIPKEIMDDISF